MAFPAIATKDEQIPLTHGGLYRRREGEPLQEAREGISTLTRIRDQVGKFNFAAQYQQTPETPEGGLFKLKYFKLIDQAPPIDSRGTLYISIDSALSTSETADYSAISVVYAVGGNFYVLFAKRGHWDYETLKSEAMYYVRLYGRRDRPVHFLIEAAGSGISLYTYLKSLRHECFYCFYYRPDKDKMYRAAIALLIVASGRVHVVNTKGNNAWVEPYINEFVNFPHGRFDDQVDSLVQLLPWADKRNSAGGGFYGVG